METFYEYFSISRTFTLMFHIIGVLSSTELETKSAVAGSAVKLQCSNQSISTVKQLTWTRNQVQTLFVYSPKLQELPDENDLDFKMSQSESQLYALIIDRAEKSHTGNYTCQTTTEGGLRERQWELTITDPEEATSQSIMLIIGATTIPCVCCLIFIIALIILQKVCRKPADTRCPPVGAQQERAEEIYENCLENRGYNRPHHCLPRPH